MEYSSWQMSLGIDQKSSLYFSYWQFSQNNMFYWLQDLFIQFFPDNGIDLVWYVHIDKGGYCSVFPRHKIFNLQLAGHFEAYNYYFHFKFGHFQHTYGLLLKYCVNTRMTIEFSFLFENQSIALSKSVHPPQARYSPYHYTLASNFL